MNDNWNGAGQQGDLRVVLVERGQDCHPCILGASLRGKNSVEIIEGSGVEPFDLTKNDQTAFGFAAPAFLAIRALKGGDETLVIIGESLAIDNNKARMTREDTRAAPILTHHFRKQSTASTACSANQDRQAVRRILNRTLKLLDDRSEREIASHKALKVPRARLHSLGKKLIYAAEARSREGA